MKSSKKIMQLSLALTSAVVLAGLIGGLSSLTNIPRTLAAPELEPVQGNSCNAVTVTNIQSQSVAAGQGEKITVDWAFNGDGTCVKVDGFEVWIEVSRRSGRKNTRKIDASSTSRSVNSTFSEAGIGNLSDKIESAKAIVTAKLANAKGERTQTGL